MTEAWVLRSLAKRVGWSEALVESEVKSLSWQVHAVIELIEEGFDGCMQASCQVECCVAKVDHVRDAEGIRTDRRSTSPTCV